LLEFLELDLIKGINEMTAVNDNNNQHLGQSHGDGTPNGEEEIRNE
jgi:hypothetical protein